LAAAHLLYKNLFFTNFVTAVMQHTEGFVKTKHSRQTSASSAAHQCAAAHSLGNTVLDYARTGC